jgi:hypothetical protein
MASINPLYAHLLRRHPNETPKACSFEQVKQAIAFLLRGFGPAPSLR